MSETLLAIRDVSLSFKGIKALTAISFAVVDGEICALIGPNGAGKSSLLNVINGVYRFDSGEIVFAGEPIGAHHYRHTGASDCLHGRRYPPLRARGRCQSAHREIQIEIRF